jgi:hypothetical protein
MLDVTDGAIMSIQLPKIPLLDCGFHLESAEQIETHTLEATLQNEEDEDDEKLFALIWDPENKSFSIDPDDLQDLEACAKQKINGSSR